MVIVDSLSRWFLGNGSFDEVEILRPILPAVGTMIDVGAHHGKSADPFIHRGWRVHAFEPDATNRTVLTKRLGSSPRVTIDPRAVSDSDHEMLPLYSSSVSTGISSLLPFHESHKVSGTVETVTLSRYCREVAIDRVDFLKIDVEGLDLFVLKGFDWRYSPAAVLCEFENRKTARLNYTVDDLVSYLQMRGYRILVSEWCPVKEYGREHRWLGLFRWGEREIDPAAWGNIVAIRSEDDEAKVLAAGIEEARGARRRYFVRYLAWRAIAMFRLVKRRWRK